MNGPTHDDVFSSEPAENYERFFVPAIGRPVASTLVDAADLRWGERVLDVACGTGIVARLAAERVGPGGSVVALDPDPAMLEVARAVAPPRASIEWHQAPAEAIPLPDGAFDVVLCGQGLMFFSDRVGGLREMRRMLSPGGRVLANMPGPAPPPLAALADALESHVGSDAAGFVRTVFALHDAHEIRGLAVDAGFDDVSVHSQFVPLSMPSPVDFLRRYAASTPLAPQVGAMDPTAREALERDYAERCAAYVEGGVMAGGVRMSTLEGRG